MLKAFAFHVEERTTSRGKGKGLPPVRVEQEHVLPSPNETEEFSEILMVQGMVPADSIECMARVSPRSD
jgi:hypothetical protein